MAKIVVKKPVDQSFTFSVDGTSTTCKLKFKGGAATEWTSQIRQAQAQLDSETMRVLEPYMPLDSGTMIKSMISATHIGDGEIKVNTPYAAKVNYLTGVMGRNGPNRGRRFFDRMKADKLDYLKSFIFKATGIRVK